MHASTVGKLAAGRGAAQHRRGRPPAEFFRPDYVEAFFETGVVHHDLPPTARTARERDHGIARPVGGGPLSYLDLVSAVMRAGTTPNGVFTAKLHWGQFSKLVERMRGLPGYDHMPAGEIVTELFPDVRHVRLTRLDKSRQAISWYRALTTDVWWQAESAPHSDDVRPDREESRCPDFDEVRRLEATLHRHEEAWDAYFEELGENPLLITYEELVRSYLPTVRRVLKYGGVWDPGLQIERPRLGRQSDSTTERWLREYTPQRSAAQPTHRPRPHQIPVAMGVGTQRARPSVMPGPAWPTPVTRFPSSSESHMRTDTIVVDNFYADPEAVRRYALKLDYYYPYERDDDIESGRQNFTWMSSWFKPADECPFKSSSALQATLEDITGEEIDLEHWYLGFPTDGEGKATVDCREHRRSCLWNCSFHLKPDNGQKLGAGVHNHVTDPWNSVDVNGWAGLIYLAPDAPVSGGLKLWRNKDPQHNYDWMTPRENWELIDDLGNVCNRLILCRGNIPHSGARGWGVSLETGRLYQTFFFRVKESRPRESLIVSI